MVHHLLRQRHRQKLRARRQHRVKMNRMSLRHRRVDEHLKHRIRQMIVMNLPNYHPVQLHTKFRLLLVKKNHRVQPIGKIV